MIKAFDPMFLPMLKAKCYASIRRYTKVITKWLHFSNEFVSPFTHRVMKYCAVKCYFLYTSLSIAI